MAKPKTILIPAATVKRDRKLRAELKAALKNKSIRKAVKLARSLNDTILMITNGAKSDGSARTTPKKNSGKKLNSSVSRKKSSKTKKANAKLEKKHRKMKEVFREIDAWNFPIGARLTSNASGGIDRGGGFMSNRRKF